MASQNITCFYEYTMQFYSGHAISISVYSVIFVLFKVGKQFFIATSISLAMFLMLSFFTTQTIIFTTKGPFSLQSCMLVSVPIC